MSTTRELFSSVHNVTTTPLLAGGEFVGEWEYLGKPDVAVSAKGDKACTVYLEFSNDQVNVDVFPPNGYFMLPDQHLFRCPLLTKRYFRIRVVNTSGEDMTYLRVYPTYGAYRQPSAPLNIGVADDADAIITRSVLIAQDALGNYGNVPSRTDGTLKVSMANPLTAFGELLVESNDPIIQLTGVYGDLGKTRQFAVGAGSSVGVDNNDFYVSSGTTSTANATIFSKKACVYRAGQGISFVFTVRFGTPEVGSVMWCGPQNSTDAIVIGYNDDVFGLFFRHWGMNEIQTLTFTVGAGASTNATVTIDGTPYTVPLTAGTTAQNARETADSINAQTSLWRAQQVGSTVVIRSVLVNTFVGAFTFSHATAVASFSQVTAGNPVTEEFIPHTDFSEGDPLEWLDPSLGNVYKVDFQYLGYGDIDIYAEYSTVKEYTLLHRIVYANSNTRTNVTNPSFRLGLTAGNRGGTTGVTAYGASAAAFTQGVRKITDSDKTFSYAKSTTTTIPLFSVKVSEVMGGKVNLSNAIIDDIAGATDSTKGAVFKLILNPTLIGPVNWSYYSQADSIMLTDVAATGYTGGQQIGTMIIGAANARVLDLSGKNIELLPNDILTITAEVTAGSASQMNGSITWKEDV